jgi:hypothetical protein
MRILLITDEVWNDDVHKNNILTNWFSNFDAEFANIYLSPGLPKNSVCKKYFQITDRMMIKSLFSSNTAGMTFQLNNKKTFTKQIENENTPFLKFLKSNSNEFVRLSKEIIWSFGRYNISSLKDFIHDFKPDIVFSPRYATLKILRLEKIVRDITNIPIVAFTGDNEYSLKIFNLSPFFWIRKFLLRSKIRTMMPIYSKFYTLSEIQNQEYSKIFGNKFDLLRKGGTFGEAYHSKDISLPIKIIYAGKLYSNRWKTLYLLRNQIKIINEKFKEKKFNLFIYTDDKLTRKLSNLLNDGVTLDNNAAVMLSGITARDFGKRLDDFPVMGDTITARDFGKRLDDIPVITDNMLRSITKYIDPTISGVDEATMTDSGGFMLLNPYADAGWFLEQYVGEPINF